MPLDLLKLDELPSVEHWGRTDRVNTPTHAGLHRCHWPQPRQLAADDVTVETYYCGHQSILTERYSRYSCNTHIFAPSLITIPGELPSWATHVKIIQVKGQLVQKMERKRTDGRTRPIALPSPDDAVGNNWYTEVTCMLTKTSLHRDNVMVISL